MSLKTAGKTLYGAANNLGEPSRSSVQKLSDEDLKNLKKVFPNLKSDDILKLSSRFPPGSNINSMATYLLDHFDEVPNCSNHSEPWFCKDDDDDDDDDDSSIETHDFESRYDYLIAVFPDADPSYLDQKCREIGDDDERMRVFIARTLESKEYPKYSNYCKKQKRKGFYKRFTENFTVEDFLELFPEPVNHFENKGPTEDKEIALTYLKYKFRDVSVFDINKSFKKHKYNFAKTYEAIKKISKHLKKPRTIEWSPRWSSYKLSFIQEVAFAENRDKIVEYENEKISRKKKEYEKAKASGNLMECSCCYKDDFLPAEIVQCTEGHLFCRECVKRGTEIAIGQGETVFRCLSDCQAEFSLNTLQEVLKPVVFSNMLHRKQMQEVEAAGITGLEFCQHCHFATIPPETDKVFKCMNPECMKETCRLCKEPNHIPLRCDEVEKNEEVRIRTMIEARMTEALVRQCWKCKKTFVKEDGCNKMTCVCGALMCYVCRQPVKDYTHFNGQGGTEFHKCPLFSNINKLHVEAVKNAAMKAKAEVLAENPNVKLKIDPTNILEKKLK